MSWLFLPPVLFAVAAVGALAGCSGAAQISSDAVIAQPAPAEATSAASPAANKPLSTATPTPVVTQTSPKPAAATPPVVSQASNATAYLSAPRAGISRAKIVTYSGVADDERGTSINDAGLIGAPRGSWGGVAPGQVGNLLLTGHRTSAGAPMGDVPALRAGDKIFVDQGDKRYVYVAKSKVTINFRSAASRALQSAAIPGSPGKTATQAAIVLSTCATPEDNAAGNYWRDQHSNPTHRIAVYGYLQSVIPS